MRKFRALAFSGVLLLGLPGCATSVADLLGDAQYWQRRNIREAVYMDKHVAQDLLHRDIAQCTVDIRDQKRMGTLRETVPANNASPLGWGGGALAHWDTPERYGYLRAEHKPYHDFETCMLYRGWERVDKLPRAAAAEARENYLKHMEPEKQEERRAKQARRSGGSSGSAGGGDYSYFNF